MAYRTLEEKFLADFAELQEGNHVLKEQVKALQEQLHPETRENKMVQKLKGMVVAEGRKALFNQAHQYALPDTNLGKRDYYSWCCAYMYRPFLPDDISTATFVEFFDDEFQRAWDRAYERDIAENRTEEE